MTQGNNNSSQQNPNENPPEDGKPPREIPINEPPDSEPVAILEGYLFRPKPKPNNRSHLGYLAVC